MRNLVMLFSALCLISHSLNCSAITVTVKSAAKDIQGLGFTVNGEKHGGMGQSYKGEKMPAGNYSFGLRKSGKDIGCTTKDGKKMTKLKSNTTALLTLKGHRCEVKINSK